MRCICITESPACRSHSSLSNAVGATPMWSPVLTFGAPRLFMILSAFNNVS